VSCAAGGPGVAARLQPPRSIAATSRSPALPRRFGKCFAAPLHGRRSRPAAPLHFSDMSRLREIHQQVADEIMMAIARLEPCEDKVTFP
jgi:hypothetical protein